MPNSAERYRAQAQELSEMAAKCDLPDMRQELLLLAAQYDKLAERAERNQGAT